MHCHNFIFPTLNTHTSSHVTHRSASSRKRDKQHIAPQQYLKYPGDSEYSSHRLFIRVLIHAFSRVNKERKLLDIPCGKSVFVRIKPERKRFLMSAAMSSERRIWDVAESLMRQSAKFSRLELMLCRSISLSRLAQM